MKWRGLRMRFKARARSIALCSAFLMSCSNSLIDYEPLTTENRLSFCSSVPIQNCDDDSGATFYAIEDKNAFDIVKERHNLSNYCSDVEEFDETYFVDSSLLMYFSYFVGDFAIGSELNNNLVTYHLYFPEVQDQVFNYFCLTTIIQKDSYGKDSIPFEFAVKTHILSYDDFIKIQDSRILTRFH